MSGGMGVGMGNSGFSGAAPMSSGNNLLGMNGGASGGLGGLGGMNFGVSSNTPASSSGANDFSDLFGTSSSTNPPASSGFPGSVSANKPKDDFADLFD